METNQGGAMVQKIQSKEDKKKERNANVTNRKPASGNRLKNNYIDNYIKSKWLKHSN